MSAGYAISRLHARGRDFDGSTMYATRGAELTGNADGKAFTVAGALRLDGGNAAIQVITGHGRFAVFRHSDNKLRIDGYNATPTLILSMTTTTTYTAGAGLIVFAASANLATGSAHFYVGDTSVIAASPTLTNDTIDFTLANWGVGASTDGTSKVNGCIYGLLYHNAYSDLSSLPVRRKFITAMGKSAKFGHGGYRAFGAQALISMPDGRTNRGSGGAFTEAAATTVANSAP